MKFLQIIAAACLVLMSVNSASSSYVIGYDETKGLFVNQTMMTYDRGHGTQVEYIAPNGKSYLLYPGNKVILEGRWKLERTAKPTVFNLCFKYAANTYNPVTGAGGNVWECQAAGFYLAAVTDHLDGDVLGLSKSSKVPFVLAKRKTSLKTLIRKLR